MIPPRKTSTTDYVNHEILPIPEKRPVSIIVYVCLCVHLCVYAGQYFVCVMLKCLVECNNEKCHEMQPPRTIFISLMMRQSSLL